MTASPTLAPELVRTACNAGGIHRCEPSHRRRRVELLGDRDKADRMPVEQLDDFGEVHQGSGQAIDLVDDHRVNPMLGDIGKQLPKRRALQGPAGEPAVIVAGLDQAPALTALTADERLASFALCMQGIEVLLEPFLRGFAGVDRAAPYPNFDRHALTPKKRGPDHLAPVIRRATSDKEP